MNPPKPTTSRHVILFFAANPSGTTRLALDEECAAIERELRMTTGREDFDFRSKWAVSIDDMMRQLNELHPTVIHFSGHGCGGADFHLQSGRVQLAPHRDIDVVTSGGIQLQGEQRQPQYVSALALSHMIRTAAPSVRLVVLNACFSDAVAETLREVVDCVVGMRGAIGDDAARSFAVGFYRALGHRSSVGNAVAQAVATLAAKRLSAEHLPVCRARNGVNPDDVVLPSLDPPTIRTIIGHTIDELEHDPEVSPRSPSYYIYISEQKVELLFSQISRRTKPRDAGMRIRIEAKPLEEARPARQVRSISELIEDAGHVAAHLRKEGLVGEPDDLTPYIFGQRQMNWGILREYAADIVFFGYQTDYYSLALVGSKTSLIGVQAKSNTSEHSPDYYLFEYLSEFDDSSSSDFWTLDRPQIGEIERLPYFQGLKSFNRFFERVLHQGDRLDFMARILARHEDDGHTVLLGSPIFVAYAD